MNRPYKPLKQGVIIRDKIPDLHQKEYPVILELGSMVDEPTKALTQKLQEEIQEYKEAQTSDEKKAESGDVADVLDEIHFQHARVPQDIMTEAEQLLAEAHATFGNEIIDDMRKKKTEAKGGFRTLTFVLSERKK